MRLRLLAALPLLVLTACGGSDNSVTPPPPGRYQPTSSTLLSTSSPTKDEDPTVILARDGSIVVAWFSDRGGNPDIYIARCTKGTTWSAPVRVTTSPDGDFYPNLYQDANGVFHLTWFRWYALSRGHIWYNQSTDPLVWDQGNEKQVTTTANVDDWVPSIAQTPDDSLRVFFVSEVRDTTNSNSDIYYASSSVDSVAFGPARKFPRSVPFANDHLPFAAWTGSQLSLVWMRYNGSPETPWLATSSELCYAVSNDGTSWSGEYLLTPDFNATVHIFPAFYRRSDGEWRLMWTTTRSGSPQVVELPLLQFLGYPGALIVNNHVGAGYSHRITRTPVDGLYLGAWVQGSDPTQDIYYRFYEN